MSYFPFMIDIENKKCLVVGGGNIACHKIQILVDFGVYIYVVAEDISKSVMDLSCNHEKIHIYNRAFKDEDIHDMDMVVAATDDEALNYHISDVCKSMKIPVNAVDMKTACSFIFPAMIKDKDMLVTVSTGGQSPAASAYIKKKIKSNIPDYYGDMIETIGQYRDMILTQVDNSRDRKEIFMELLEYGDAHNGDIPEELVYSLVHNKKRVD